jgi:hypothetical protein
MQNTSHAVPDELHVEVEEEADAKAGEPEVCEELCAVYIVEVLHGFHFDDDSIPEQRSRRIPVFRFKPL